MRNAKRFAWAAAAAALLLLPAVALAQAAPGAQPGTSVADIGLPFGKIKTDGSLLKGLLNGALAGLLASFMGWIKNRNSQTGELERFQVKYLVPTVLAGLLAGAIGAWLKMSPADLVTALEASPFYTFVVFGIEAVIKAIYRNTVPFARDLLSDIKSGAGNPTPPPPPTQ